MSTIPAQGEFITSSASQPSSVQREDGGDSAMVYPYGRNSRPQNRQDTPVGEDEAQPAVNASTLKKNNRIAAVRALRASQKKTSEDTAKKDKVGGSDRDSDKAVSEARATIGNHSGMNVGGGNHHRQGGAGGHRGRRGAARGRKQNPATGNSAHHGDGAASEAGKTIAQTVKSSKRGAQSSAAGMESHGKSKTAASLEPAQETGIPHRDDVCAPLKLIYMRPNYNRPTEGARFDLGEGSVVQDPHQTDDDEQDEQHEFSLKSKEGGTALSKASREERRLMSMIADGTLFDGNQEEESANRRIRMIVSSFMSASGVIPKSSSQKRNEQLLKGMFAEASATLAREYVRLNVGAVALDGPVDVTSEVVDDANSTQDEAELSSKSQSVIKRATMSSLLLSDTEMYTKLKSLSKSNGGKASSPAQTKASPLPPPSGPLPPLSQPATAAHTHLRGTSAEASPKRGMSSTSTAPKDGAGDPRWILFDVQELVEEEQRRIIRDYRTLAHQLQDRDHLNKMIREEKTFRDSQEARSKQEAALREEQAFEMVLQRKRRESEMGPSYARPTSRSNQNALTSSPSLGGCESRVGSAANSATRLSGRVGSASSLQPPLGNASMVSTSPSCILGSAASASLQPQSRNGTISQRRGTGFSGLSPMLPPLHNSGVMIASPLGRSKSIAFTADNTPTTKSTPLPPPTALPHLLSTFFHLHLDFTKLKRRVVDPDSGEVSIEPRRITPTEMIYIVHYLVTLQNSNGSICDIKWLLQRRVNTPEIASQTAPSPYDCSCADIDDFGGEDAVTILQSVVSVGSINLSNLTVDPSLPLYTNPRSPVPNHVRTANNVVNNLLLNNLLKLCPTLGKIALPIETDIHAPGYLPVDEPTKRHLMTKLSTHARNCEAQESRWRRRNGGEGLENRLDGDQQYFDEWEASERAGLLQLESTNFKKIKKEEHAFRTGIISSLQAIFTRKQHAEQRSTFVHVSLGEMIPQRVFAPEARQRELIVVSFIETQENIMRHTVLRSMRRMLEQIQREKREDLVVVREHIRSKERILKAACDSFCATEERSRRKLGGQALAPFLIFNCLFRRFATAKARRLVEAEERRRKQKEEEEATMRELQLAEEQARLREEEIRLFRLNHAQKNARAMVEAVESRARNVCIQEEYVLEVDLLTEFVQCLRQVAAASAKCVAEAVKIESHIKASFPPLRLLSPLNSIAQQRTRREQHPELNITAPSPAMEAAASAATNPNFYVGGTPLPLLPGWGIRAALEDDERFQKAISHQLNRIKDVLRPKYDSATDMMNFRLESLRKAVSKFVYHEMGEDPFDGADSSFGSQSQVTGIDDSLTLTKGTPDVVSLSEDQSSLQQRFENFLKGHGEKGELMSMTQVQAFLAADHNPVEARIVLECARINYDLALQRHQQKKGRSPSVTATTSMLQPKPKEATPKHTPRENCPSYHLLCALPGEAVPPIRFVPEGEDVTMHAFVLRGGSKITIRASDVPTPGGSFIRRSSLSRGSSTHTMDMNITHAITVGGNDANGDGHVTFGAMVEEADVESPLMKRTASGIRQTGKGMEASHAPAKYPALVDEEDFIGFLSSTYDRDRRHPSGVQFLGRSQLGDSSVTPMTPGLMGGELNIRSISSDTTTSTSQQQHSTHKNVNPMTITSTEAFGISLESLLSGWTLQRVGNSHVSVVLAQDAAFPMRLLPFLLGAFTFVSQKQSEGLGARTVYFDVSASLFVTIPRIRLWCADEDEFHDALNGEPSSVEGSKRRASTQINPLSLAKPFTTTRLVVQGVATGHVSLTFFNVSPTGTFYALSPSWLVAPSKLAPNDGTLGTSLNRSVNSNAVTPKSSNLARTESAAAMFTPTSSQRGVALVEVDEYSSVEAGRLFESVHISAPSSFFGDTAVGASLLVLAGDGGEVDRRTSKQPGAVTPTPSFTAASQRKSISGRRDSEQSGITSRRVSAVSVASSTQIADDAAEASSPYEFIEINIQQDRYERADMLVLSASHRSGGEGADSLSGKMSLKKAASFVSPSNAPAMRRVVSVAFESAAEQAQAKPVMGICHSRSKEPEPTPSSGCDAKQVTVVSTFDTPCYIYNTSDPSGAIVAVVTHGRIFTPSEATQHRALGMYADCHRVRISFANPFKNVNSDLHDTADNIRMWRPITLLELESLVHQFCFVNRNPAPSLWPMSAAAGGGQLDGFLRIKEEETVLQTEKMKKAGSSFGFGANSKSPSAPRASLAVEATIVDAPRPPSPLRKRKPISVQLCDITGSTQVVHVSVAVRRVTGSTILSHECLPREAAFGGAFGGFASLYQRGLNLRRTGSEMPKRRPSMSSSVNLVDASGPVVKKTFAVCSANDFLAATAPPPSAAQLRPAMPPVSFLFADSSLLNPDTDHFSGGMIELSVQSQPAVPLNLKSLHTVVKGPTANLASASVEPSHDLCALGCVSSRLRTLEQNGATGKQVVAARQSISRAIQVSDLYAIADSSVVEEEKSRSWLSLVDWNDGQQHNKAGSTMRGSSVIRADTTTGLITFNGVPVAKVIKGCVISSTGAATDVVPSAPCSRFWNGRRVSSLEDLADTFETTSTQYRRRASLTHQEDPSDAGTSSERSVVLRIQMFRSDLDGHSITYDAAEAILRSICFSSCTFPKASSGGEGERGEGVTRSLVLTILPGLSDGKVDVLKNVLLNYTTARERLRKRIVLSSEEESAARIPSGTAALPSSNSVQYETEAAIHDKESTMLFTARIERMTLDEATTALASISALPPPVSLGLSLQLLPVLVAPATSITIQQTLKGKDPPPPVLSYRVGQGNVRLPQLEISKDAPDEWVHGVVMAIEVKFALHPVFARVRAAMNSGERLLKATAAATATEPATMSFEDMFRDATSSLGEGSTFERLLPVVEDNDRILRRLAGAASHGDTFTLISHDFDLIPISQSAGSSSGQQAVRGMLDATVTSGSAAKQVNEMIRRLAEEGETGKAPSADVPSLDGLVISCVEEVDARYSSLSKHRFVKGCQSRGYDKRFPLCPPHEQFPAMGLEGIAVSDELELEDKAATLIECYLVKRELLPDVNGNLSEVSASPPTASAQLQALKSSGNLQRSAPSSSKLSLQHPAVMGTFSFDFRTSRAIVHITKKTTSKEIQSLLKALAYVKLSEDVSPMPFSSPSTSVAASTMPEGALSLASARELCQSFLSLESPLVKSLRLVVADPGGGGNSRISMGVATEGSRKAPQLITAAPQQTSRMFADVDSVVNRRLLEFLFVRTWDASHGATRPSFSHHHKLLHLGLGKFVYAEDQEALPPSVVTLRLRPLVTEGVSPQSLKFVSAFHQESARLRQFILPGLALSRTKRALSHFSFLALVPLVDDQGKGSASSRRAEEIALGKPFIEHSHPSALIGVPITPAVPAFNPTLERQGPNLVANLRPAPSQMGMVRTPSSLRQVGQVPTEGLQSILGSPKQEPHDLAAGSAPPDLISDGSDPSTPRSPSDYNPLDNTLSSVFGAASPHPEVFVSQGGASEAPPEVSSRLFKLIHITLKGYSEASGSTNTTEETENAHDLEEILLNKVVSNSISLLPHVTQESLSNPNFTSIASTAVEDENVIGLVEMFFAKGGSSTEDPLGQDSNLVTSVRAHLNSGVHCDILTYFLSLWAVESHGGVTPLSDAAVRIGVSLPGHKPTQKDLIVYSAPSILQVPILPPSAAVGWRTGVQPHENSPASFILQQPLYVSPPLRISPVDVNNTHQQRRSSIPSVSLKASTYSAGFSICDSKFRLSEEAFNEQLSTAQRVAALGPVSGIAPTNKLRCATVHLPTGEGPNSHPTSLVVDTKKLTTGGVIKFAMSSTGGLEISVPSGAVIEPPYRHAVGTPTPTKADAFTPTLPQPPESVFISVFVDGTKAGSLTVSAVSVVLNVTSTLLTPFMVQEIIGCVTVTSTPPSGSQNQSRRQSQQSERGLIFPSVADLRRWVASCALSSETLVAVSNLSPQLPCVVATMMLFEDHNPWPTVANFLIPFQITGNTKVNREGAETVAKSGGTGDTESADPPTNASTTRPSSSSPQANGGAAEAAVETSTDAPGQGAANTSSNVEVLRGSAPPVISPEED